MSGGLLTALKDFTEKQTGLESSNITEETALEEDLGIYGDDAVEYIVSFGKVFNVNVSRFMAADYFSPDGLDIFGTTSRKKKVLTFSHLMKAINAGRLDEDVINE